MGSANRFSSEERQSMEILCRLIVNLIKTLKWMRTHSWTMLSSLEGSKFFTSLDLFSGYWQIEIAESEKSKTAFIIPEGLYEFNVLPFGLASSPACFQRCMDQVLSGLKYNTCIVYLDDVLIKGENLFK